MRQTPSYKRAEENSSVWVHHCPKCDPSHVMNIKWIRPSMFTDYDLIVYECRQCKDEKIVTMK